MRIEQDIKLDFKDVLIRPKRSTLTSRSEVDIARSYEFLHSKKKYHGIPIIAANMDTTGTMEMARALAAHQLSTALHKHYEEDELLAFFADKTQSSNAFYSMGITTPDFDKFKRVMDRANGTIENVCVDVANGYTKAFISFIHKLRAAYPEITIMAGNVVTGEMTEELILDGVDVVVNLSGAPIGTRRWTSSYRTTIVESRTRTSHVLSTWIAAQPEPPALVQASAIGRYPDSGAVPLDESAPVDDSFLGHVVETWESAATPARRAADSLPPIA